MDGSKIMFYKKNNELQKANEIHGPGWSLTSKNKEEKNDGWKWFETEEEAVQYFSNGQELSSEVKISEEKATELRSIVPADLSFSKASLLALKAQNEAIIKLLEGKE
jgi:hypothetical protein